MTNTTGLLEDNIAKLSFKQQKLLLAKLAEFITDSRKKKIAKVVENRTLKLAVLLEDLYQPHNISACLRSLELLGVLQVHILERKNAYRANQDVSMGSDRWLKIFKHKTNKVADYQKIFNNFRKQGLQIVTTHLVEQTQLLDEKIVAKKHQSLNYQINQINFDKKTLVCFGTEEKGLSKTIKGDYNINIPAYGFTQSYNISVALALLISEFRKIMTQNHQSFLNHWALNADEKLSLSLHYYLTSAKSSAKILPRLLKQL